MRTIDQVIAEKLGTWYVSEWPIGNFFLCVIALVLTVILSGAIGLERERRGRTAGLRTHLLVGLGSCIIMIISIYGFPSIYIEGELFERDVARLAAQVVTGVGFLGAGAIIHKKDGIRGLTTAATIWISMAIGLACGSMNFILAIGGTIIILVSLTVLKGVENKIAKRAPFIILHTEIGKPIVDKMLELAKKNNCEIKEIQCEITDGLQEITFQLILHDSKFDVQGFILKLGEIDGVCDSKLLSNHK